MTSRFSERQLHAGRKLQAAGDLGHFLGHMGFRLCLGVATGRDDEVFDNLDALRAIAKAKTAS